jgi:erythromycin esterase
MAAPDATVQSGTYITKLGDALGQAKKIFQMVTGAKQSTTINSLRLVGSEALVSRKTESTVTLGGQTRAGVDIAEDTWVRTGGGWLLKATRVTGSHENNSPTNETAAEVVGAELRLNARSMDDIEEIGKAIGDARVVGLGEATHGTLEVQMAKARIIRYLVEKKGFTVLAVEANWPESLAVDEYVKTGQGEPKEALMGLRMWPLQTKEMLGIIGFLRVRNQQMAGPKVTFSGFDMQDSGAAMEKVLSYLRRYGPAHVGAAEQAYQYVRGLGPRHDGTDPGGQQAAEQARKVVQLLEINGELLVQASSESEWRYMRHSAEIVSVATSLRIEGQRQGYRDEMMAQNVEWLTDEVHRGEKVILWAHNFHVGADSREAPKPMGSWLRSRLGAAYYALGFAVAGGEVRAVGSNGLNTYPMPRAAPGTGDGVLALSGMPKFFLDLRGLAKGSELSGWMVEPHSFYSVGARWNQSDPESNKSVFSMALSFDGMVFIRDGHPSIGIE